MTYENELFHYYSGSPGLKSDFSLVTEKLNNSHISKQQINLAYSFGCRQALIDFKNAERQYPLILIAPYPFPQSSPSVMTKSLLNLPYLGNAFLNLLGPKSIKKFLLDSSNPCSVPKAYEEQSKLYLDPRILKKSILEKEVSNEELNLALKAIAKGQKTKICLIRGENDKTSEHTQQIRPLLENLKLYETIIPKAGHALIWTHPQEVANAIKDYLEKYHE